MTPRVAIVSPDPESTGGGVERFCWLLRDALQSANWDVKLVGPSRARESKWTRRLGLDAEYARRDVANAVRSLDVDLVITNGYLGGAVRCPSVHVLHGTLPGHAWAGRVGTPWRAVAQQAVGGGLAEHRAGRAATEVVAVSEFAAREARRWLRLDVNSVIPNGVDTSVFSPGPRDEARLLLNLPPDERIALFVGRVESRKGSLALGLPQEEGFKLAVAGGPHRAADFELGRLHPKRLALAYRAADCVYFPSRYEGCSFVILEALASGVPLVTTRVGWIPEFLREVPDYTPSPVAPDDVQGLRTGLRAVAGAEARDFAVKASDFVLRNASFSVFSARWVDLARQVAERA